MNELEQRWHDLGEFIREQRRIGHLSLRKLSEMAGISNPYLSQIERGLRKPSAEILQQIARALEISSETLYVRAGILDERDLESDLVSEIRRDPYINEEQKKTLIHIYDSFRTEHGGPSWGNGNGNGRPAGRDSTPPADDPAPGSSASPAADPPAGPPSGPPAGPPSGPPASPSGAPIGAPHEAEVTSSEESVA